MNVIDNKTLSIKYYHIVFGSFVVTTWGTVGEGQFLLAAFLLHVGQMMEKFII